MSIKVSRIALMMSLYRRGERFKRDNKLMAGVNLAPPCRQGKRQRMYRHARIGCRHLMSGSHHMKVHQGGHGNVGVGKRVAAAWPYVW